MEKIEREDQIEILETLEERLERYAQSWLADSDYRDALHRYDCEHEAPPLRRVAG